ncbi:DUF7577 domain-containing protein [Haloarcula onubensis]|uniref:Zinc ribbon domain-containing protein n=1 Tax=Haloarcula onubensis TaxID=2950539 RepID=A0ABU2FPB8_9EURY|nr:zinc ribbon domain-containing protein [Halomicroarcula sp. S3CR25-11]MDS0282590.1 zinc ribbon domain-containing protein [Halomicroarcula sp. S3CR25-11]
MALGQLELAARVAAGLFVIVAPTLLFLALWHGLQAMQDDALVERVRQRATEQSGSAVSVSSPAVSCPACGAGNRDGVAYCQQCLSRL